MRNFTKNFVIEGERAADGTLDYRSVKVHATLGRVPEEWSSYQKLLLSTWGNRLWVMTGEGQAVTLDELFLAMTEFLLQYEKRFGEAVPIFQREKRYRFSTTLDHHGHKDVFIETDLGRTEGVRRKLLFHSENPDKVWDFNCSVGDFLNFCVVSNVLGTRDGRGRKTCATDFAAKGGYYDATRISARTIWSVGANRKRFEKHCRGYDSDWVIP